MPADIDLDDEAIADGAMEIGSWHIIANGSVLLGGPSRRYGWRLLRVERSGYIHISIRSY
jgi:hypothetical protein